MHQETILVRDRVHRIKEVSESPVRDHLFLFFIFHFQALITWYFFARWLQTCQTLFFNLRSFLRELLLFVEVFILLAAFWIACDWLLLFLKAFFFLESIISLDEFGFPLILFDLFVANLAEKLLSMGSYLAKGPVFHILLDFLPVLSMSLQKFFEKIYFSLAPSTRTSFLGCFGFLIHFGRYCFGLY